MQIAVNGGCQMDDRPARAPDPGFDVLGIGLSGIAEYELGHLVQRKSF
jgi:hypothetical protein